MIDMTKCDDCRVMPAVLKYPGDTITYYLCLGCASKRKEYLRKRLAYLNKAIRTIRAKVPEAWQEFMKEGQTS